MVGFAAHAQQPPSLEAQVNADAAAMASASTRGAAILDTWRQALLTLGAQRDNLQAQVAVQTKWIDVAKKIDPDMDAKVTTANKADAPK